MTELKLKNNKESLFVVIFLCLAVILTIGVGEIFLRILSSKKLIYNIEMVKYAKNLKMPDPNGIVSHIHKINSNTDLMGVNISLNSLGHRGKELPLRVPETKRIFVLGSSVTMGWGVPLGKVFTSLVETKLNVEKPFGPQIIFEIANAGIGNYNTFFQYQLFLRQLTKVDPDMVVLHYFISDVEPRSKGRNNFILEHSYFADYLYNGFSILKYVIGARKDLFTYYKELYQDDNINWQNTLGYIEDMRKKTEVRHASFLIMIIPDFHNLSQTSPYKELYDKMFREFTGRGIPTINTFGTFQELYGGREADVWIQADDPHPNAKGHEIMADILYDYLIQDNPLHLEK